MSASASSPKVRVKVRGFIEFFTKLPNSLVIDSYQRPYVWSEAKIDQLLADLKEFSSSSDDRRYYIGTILLHDDRAKSRHCIIDGQQRLTTLCVLYFIMHGKLPPHCDLSFRNPISKANIKVAQTRLIAASLPSEILKRICFTLITVADEDLAFTFFDTQNNRGVPLAATDLLKAFHLRAIAGPSSTQLTLQKSCASRWERMQGTPAILGKKTDFAPTLFHHFLWRSRRWTGQKFDDLESNNDILAEFQTRTTKAKSADRIPLYASRSNRLADELTLLPKDKFRFDGVSVQLIKRPSDLPFALRQPITQGVGFFLYADKYADLARSLLDNTSDDRVIRAFYHFYEAVIRDLSIYLRELFLLSCMLYADQFGTRRLLGFALWLDHALGAIRIHKDYVFAQAPIIFLRDAPMNLLDVISSAYRAEDVTEYLETFAAGVGADRPDDIYRKEAVTKNGVKLAYKNRVLAYYGKTKSNSLKGRRSWITMDFIRAKLKAA
jgi:hypothetical protein